MDDFLKKIKDGINNRKPADIEILNKKFRFDLLHLTGYMNHTPVNNEYFVNIQRKLNTILTNKYEDILIYDYYLKSSTVGIFDLVIMFTQTKKEDDKEDKDISYEFIYRLNPDLSYKNILNSCTENLKIKYENVTLPWFRISST